MAIIDSKTMLSQCLNQHDGIGSVELLLMNAI